MTAEPSFYIGYFDLAAWAKDASGDRIYASMYRDPGPPGQYGTRLDRLVIECAQPQDGKAIYCRIPVGSVNYLNGQPWDGDTEQRFERAEQAWQIVQEWLIEQGFKIHNGLISMPRDLKLVDGSASFIGYDKTNGYHRK